SVWTLNFETARNIPSGLPDYDVQAGLLFQACPTTSPLFRLRSAEVYGEELEYCPNSTLILEPSFLPTATAYCLLPTACSPIFFPFCSIRACAASYSLGISPSKIASFIASLIIPISLEGLRLKVAMISSPLIGG